MTAPNLVQHLLAAGVLTDDDDAVMVYDLAVQAARRAMVRQAFPLHWHHHVAIKTNPAAAVLRPAVEDGFGLEAASGPEVLHGLRLGAGSVVWNSPVKTEREVRAAFRAGRPILVLDSLGELPLLDHGPDDVLAGLRVNPQIGTIGPADMSCATDDSKFGEPIASAGSIVDAFASEPRLRALHVHSGSLPDELTALVDGVRVLLDLRRDIDAARAAQGMSPVEVVDIGGGLPPDDDGATVIRYAAELADRCPELFDPSLTVVTELGRYYHASAGCTLSRIAQVKRHPAGQTIVHHVGADLFVRESYQGTPTHRFDVLDPTGQPRSGGSVVTNVAGPLCFAGDHLARDVALPEASAGDWLVVHDTGSNSLGLWSHHCSRARPALVTWNSDDPAQQPLVAIPRQEAMDAIAVWGT